MWWFLPGQTASVTYVSYAVSLKVANHFRQHVGNVDLMPKGSASIGIDDLLKLFENERRSEVERCVASLDPAAVATACKREYETIDSGLNRDHDDWKALIPGRPILKRFAAQSMQDYATLKRLYVKAAKTLR